MKVWAYEGSLALTPNLSPVDKDGVWNMLVESWKVIICRWEQWPCLEFKSHVFSEVAYGPTKQTKPWKIGFLRIYATCLPRAKKQIVGE